MNHIKDLFKESSIYGFGLTLGKICPFLLVPVYVRTLTTEQYGTFFLLFATFAIIQLLTSMALNNGIYRYYYDAEDELFKNKLIGSWLFSQIIMSSIVVLFGIIFLDKIATFFEPVNKLYEAIFWGFCIIPFQLVNNICIHVFKIQRKPKQAILLQLIDLVLFSVLTAILLFSGFELASPFIGQFFTKFFISIFCLTKVLYKSLNFKLISFTLLWKVFLFSWPLLPGALSWWAMGSIDRFLISSFINTESVSFYGLAVTVCTPVYLISNSIQTALGPLAMSIKDKPEAKQTYADIYQYIVVIMGFITIIIAYASPAIIDLIATPDYYPSLKPIPFYLVALIAIISFNVFCIGLSIAEKTKYIATGMIGGTIFNFCSNMCLIPWLGITGAAISNFLGFTVCSLIILYYERKYYKTPFPLIKIGIYLLYLFICMIMFYFTLGETSINSIIRISIVVSMLIVNYFMLRNLFWKRINIMKSLTLVKEFVQNRK